MSRQTEPKHTDDDVDNVALLSAQSIIDAEKFKNREPIVKVKIEFEEAQLFKATYFQNQRNSLRCFPACSIGYHQKDKFCGRSLHALIKIRRKLDNITAFNPYDIHLLGSFSSLADFPKLDPDSSFRGEVERILPDTVENGELVLSCIAVFNSNCRAWKIPNAQERQYVFCTSIYLPVCLLGPGGMKNNANGATHFEVSSFHSPKFNVKFFRKQSELATVIDPSHNNVMLIGSARATISVADGLNSLPSASEPSEGPPRDTTLSVDELVMLRKRKFDTMRSMKID